MAFDKHEFRRNKDYSKERSILSSTSLKSKKLENFEVTPNIKRKLRDLKELGLLVNFKRVGSLCVKMELSDTVKTTNKLSTTVNTESEILEKLDHFSIFFLNGMNITQREWFYFQKGEPEDYSELPEESTRRFYDKSKKIRRLIRNPFRVGSINYQNLEAMAEIMEGKSHKDLLKLKFKAGLIKKCWNKGLVVFED